MAASPGIKVTIEDTALRALFKDLDGLARTSTTIGYHETTPVPDSTLDVPTLALIQEFGTDKIPARPFMRSGIKAAIPRIEFVAAVQVGAVAYGETSPVRALVAIGDAASARVLEQLETTRAWAEPNAPFTIKMKQGDTPLYAKHGQLRKELKFAVLDKEHQLLLESPTE